MKSGLVENKWQHFIITGNLSNQSVFHSRDLLWKLIDLKVLRNEIYAQPMKLQFHLFKQKNSRFGAETDLSCNSGDSQLPIWFTVSDPFDLGKPKFLWERFLYAFNTRNLFQSIPPETCSHVYRHFLEPKCHNSTLVKGNFRKSDVIINNILLGDISNHNFSGPTELSCGIFFFLSQGCMWAIHIYSKWQNPYRDWGYYLGSEKYKSLELFNPIPITTTNIVSKIKQITTWLVSENTLALVQGEWSLHFSPLIFVPRKEWGMEIFPVGRTLGSI